MIIANHPFAQRSLNVRDENGNEGCASCGRTRDMHPGSETAPGRADFTPPRCEKCGRYPIDHRNGACIYPAVRADVRAPQCEADGVRNGPDGPGGTEHYWSCTEPGTVDVDGALMCEDHAGERGYGPRQQEYGYDQAAAASPGRAARAAFEVMRAKAIEQISVPQSGVPVPVIAEWDDLDADEHATWQAVIDAAQADLLAERDSLTGRVAELVTEGNGLRDLVAEILSVFGPSGSGHTARAGQVQIAKWRERAGLER